MIAGDRPARYKRVNMARSKFRMMAAAVCLVGVSCSGDVAPQGPAIDLQIPAGDSKGSASDSDVRLSSESKPFDGLWSGSWGAGNANGVFFQPVVAEMFIKGEHVELHGFRNASRLSGTVRFDANARQMQITPTAAPGAEPAPKTINYTYDLKGDELTLTDSDNVSLNLQKLRDVQNPRANAQVELVEATGINAAGELLVTEFILVRAGQAGTEYFLPQDRKLNIRQATVLEVHETGLKQITLDEARRLIQKSMPVAVTYRHDDRPPQQQFHELWKELGPPMPDSDAARNTFARTLRPGTLVFILSARDNVPVP